jgi:hypothetical protein
MRIDPAFWSLMSDAAGGTVPGSAAIAVAARTVNANRVRTSREQYREVTIIILLMLIAWDI